MNRFLKTFGFAAACVCATGCSVESPWQDVSGDGEGSIELRLRTSGRLSGGIDDVTRGEGDGAASTTIPSPHTDLFSIRLANADGTGVQTWTSVADFIKEAKFKVGSYTLEAFYGDPKAQGHSGATGYENAYFYGKTENVIVVENETTTVDISASLGNSAVKVEYGDAFKKYFTSWSTTLTAAGCDPVNLGASEDIHFITPASKVAVGISATFQNGKTTSMTPASFAAEARCLHTIRYDVFDGEVGETMLSITFPEDVDSEEIVISLSDELGNVALPEVTVDGFSGDADTPMIMQSGIPATEDLVFNLSASGGIEKAVLSVVSDTYQPGWLADGEIDLVGGNPTAIASAQAAGVRRIGLDNPGTLAAVDITGICSELPTGSHKFYMQVTDRKGQVSGSAVIALETFTIETTVASAVSTYGDGTATVTLNYNGPDPTAPGMNPFRFECNYGYHFEPVEIVSINDVPYAATRAFESAEYAYRLRIRDIQADEIPVRVFLGNATEPLLTASIKYSYPDYTLATDAFAKSVRFRFTGTDAAHNALLATRLKTELNGTMVTPTLDQSTGIFTVAGLTPATQYTLKTWLSQSKPETPKENAFTTEAATPVPNGDFENLTQTINLTLNQGGAWTKTLLATSGHQTTLTMTVSEPSGWLSNNSVTCNLNSSNKNSWYMVPAVVNSTVIWISHQPEAKALGAGQSAHDTTAELYKSLHAKSGDHAMIIRNVAWDTAGPAIELHKQTGNGDYSNYFSSKVPAIANRSAGKMWLGTSSTEGVAFTSRPVKLTGWWMYENDSHDANEKAVVEVVFLAGDKTLATGRIELGSASTYQKFEIPVNLNANFGEKPDRLKLSITSSNRNSDIKTSDYCNKDECASRGAMLSIDQLEFEY